MRSYERKEKIAKKERRVRNFAFLLYEESAQPEWKERISKLALPCFYIYHDKDIENGKKKKPHYHVLFLLNSMHSREQILEIVEYIGGANGVYENVVDSKSYARYLCHLDNPEKHRYSFDEVVSLGGLDYFKYMATDSDKLRIVKEIIEYSKEHNIYSFADLVDYSKDNNYAWFRALCGFSGRVVREYIKSKYWSYHSDLVN